MQISKIKIIGQKGTTFKKKGLLFLLFYFLSNSV